MLKETYQLLINGQHLESSTGETFITYNPATGEPLARIASAGAEDVDRAVEAARTGFEKGKWSRFSASKRGQVLMKVAQIMRQRFDQLVELEILNSGKSLSAAKGQVNQAIEDFEFYAGATVTLAGETIPVPNGFFNYTLREPVGVCAQIIPWNYPIMMAAWKIAPALAAGNTIVLKPASLTPITALVLGDICMEAGVPDGVVNVVTGSGAVIGSYLAEHPGVDKVAFTGETTTGKDIMVRASANLKRVTLELGGKSANIVFADADLDAAIDGSLYGIFYNTGQSCEARSRLFVHESIYGQFVEKFVEKAKKLKIGNPLDPNTHVGAVISAKQEEVIDSYVKLGLEEGATLLYGGKRPEGEEFARGHWYMPTILADMNNQMRVAQEEIFGPVVVIIKFSDEKDVIAQANDSIYGLAAAIWTKDFGKAHRVAAAVKAGIVMVNSPFSTFPGLPFGGYKQSGFGRELALETLNLYTETKSVISYIGEKAINPFGV